MILRGEFAGEKVKHFGGEGPSVAFSPDGKTVLTGSADGKARLWRLPPPVEGDSGRLSLWAQVVTGMELDADRVLRVLDAPTWHQRRAALARLPGPPLP
jgi:WD40 repeat protein